MLQRIIYGLVIALIATSLNAQQANLEVRGKVLDKTTNQPIPQCNIYIKDAYLGTVTNNSGEFSLKIPEEFKDHMIVASRIGFEPVEKPLILVGMSWRIKLEPSALLLSEVVIQDVETMLIQALNRIGDNYPVEQQTMTSFYREVVKKNKKYVDVSQGVINISKSPYEDNLKDALNIVKGSRSRNYQQEDTLAFRIMGGPNVMLLLDIVKNPGLVMDREILEKYRYSLRGSEMIDGRRNYVIAFTPAATFNVPLYAGLIYIDETSLAISGLEFAYDETNLKLATSNLVKRKPLFVRVKPLKISYEVKYRETNGLWYLDYVRNEVTMKCNWKRKLFNSTFTAVSEMVVTEKSKEDAPILTAGSALASHEVFSDKVSGFQDADFWEGYSIIEPEEDLQKALAKIDRKKQNK